jgi:hypothetical protein
MESLAGEKLFFMANGRADPDTSGEAPVNAYKKSI